MKLTQIDIQQQQFRKVLRGYDAREVQGFLDLIGQQVGEVARDMGDLRSELRRSRRDVEEYQSREESLKQAMLTAQHAIDEIGEQAKKESELIISEAELRAERILQGANERVGRTIDEIADLRRQKLRAIEELRGILSTHGKIIDSYDEAEAEASQAASVTVLQRLRPPAPPAPPQEFASQRKSSS